MTVTTNERGQQNLFAREPRMYVSQTDAERYGYETYAERAEKLNGRTHLEFLAMSHQIYYTGGVFLVFSDSMTKYFTLTTVAFFCLLGYTVEQLAETY